MDDDHVLRCPSEQARARVLAFLADRRSMLIGEAALAIGPLWSLEETEALLEALVRERVLSRDDASFPVRYILAKPV